jgi:Putative DNA-binding domain
VPTRLSKPLTDWTAEDVRALVDERVEEGQRLEFKRELNLETQSQRIEAAKDLSGMANAAGGILIVGVEEATLADGRRLPLRPAPMQRGDLQARLEDVLASSVSPPVNLAAATLEADGGYFLVVRVQQRSGPPHMVEGYGQNRYFLRSGLSTRPMQAHEVERAFSDLGRSDERLLAMLEGLPLIARIDNQPRTRDQELDLEPGVTPLAHRCDRAARRVRTTITNEACRSARR